VVSVSLFVVETVSRFPIIASEIKKLSGVVRTLLAAQAACPGFGWSACHRRRRGRI